METLGEVWYLLRTTSIALLDLDILLNCTRRNIVVQSRGGAGQINKEITPVHHCPSVVLIVCVRLQIFPSFLPAVVSDYDY